MENLKYIYDKINDWIKNADQKAMILGSFNIAGFIYQLVNINKLVCMNTTAIILVMLSAVSTFFALFFWLMILYPRLDNKHKKSKIYFLHIANAYEDDINAGINDFINLEDDKIKTDLASQIVINSIIAKRKYKYIQKFIWAFACQILFLIFWLFI
jgi:hypothetical protein